MIISRLHSKFFTKSAFRLAPVSTSWMFLFSRQQKTEAKNISSAVTSGNYVFRKRNKQINVQAKSSEPAEIQKDLKIVQNSTKKVFTSRKIMNNSEPQPIKNQSIQNPSSGQTKSFHQQIIQCDSLQSLLLHRKTIFEQHINLLPHYLDALRRYLTAESLLLHQSALQYINSQLNSSSLQLSIAPLEYLTIISYRYDFLRLQSRYSASKNFIFQRKATLACATYIHKRQLQFSQVIFVLEVLLHMGSTSVLLFMNFIKYIKGVFQHPEHRSRVRLEQLVTIMNTNFIKRNQITLENVLYDQVLNYMVSNMQYYLTEDAFMRVEVLSILLVVDCKRFYKTDRYLKQLWIKKLLLQITQKLNQQCVRGLLRASNDNKQETESYDGINWIQAISLVQKINFVNQNRLQSEVYFTQFEQFLQKFFKIFQKEVNQCVQQKYVIQAIDSKNKDLIMRLLFNQSMLKRWILRTKIKSLFQIFINKLKIDRQSSFYPLVDAFYLAKISQQTLVLQNIIHLIRETYKKYIKQNLVIWPLAAILVQTTDNPKQCLKLINEVSLMGQTNKIDQQPILSYLILLKQYTKMFPENKFQIKQQIITRIQQNFSDMRVFISRIYSSSLNFRRVQLMGSAIDLFDKIFPKVHQYLRNIKNRKMLDQDSVQILHFLISHICNKDAQKLDNGLQKIFQILMKEEVVIYQFLVQCYPENFPHPGQYNKRVNILSNPATFNKNFETIIKLFNLPKHAYFLWDLLIKNFVKLPRSTRGQCFSLVQKVFLVAFQKQNLRKIILLTVLTNHISSNTIIAPKQQLQSLLQHCIQDLIKAEQIIQYHYQCYLDIVTNMLSFNLLSDELFETIMAHTFDKSPNIKQTSSLMLLYGSTLSSNYQKTLNERNQKMIANQTSYLKMLVRNKLIKLKVVKDLDVPQRQQTGVKRPLVITISGKLIAIFLRFNLKEIVSIQQIVLTYIRQICDFTEWMLIAHSYKPENYSLQNPQQLELQHGINRAMLDRMHYLRQFGVISEEQEQLLVGRFK